jgi:precorrin-6A synthase
MRPSPDSIGKRTLGQKPRRWLAAAVRRAFEGAKGRAPYDAILREATPRTGHIQVRVRTLLVIGIGVGNPEQLTLEAVQALNQVDVFFVMDKGPAKADLNALRKRICERFVKDRAYRVLDLPDNPRDPAIEPYEARVASWHHRRARLYEESFATELADNRCGGILVWGDPSLYDSTLRVIEQVAARGLRFDYRVIPGISSVQALAASHRIALNRIGGSVHFTTGRRLAAAAREGHDDVVVMLDGECSWKALDPDAFEIYWGAYLGWPQERVIKGVLSDVTDEIERVRSALRAEHGWIMDTYLVRRIGETR